MLTLLQNNDLRSSYLMGRLCVPKYLNRIVWLKWTLINLASLMIKNYLSSTTFN